VNSPHLDPWLKATNLRSQKLVSNWPQFSCTHLRTLMIPTVNFKLMIQKTTHLIAETSEWAIQPVPWKMRLEMVKEMQIEILNGRETLVNCKFKLNKNLNLNLYREIPRSANPIKISIRLCTVRYREIWFFSILISEWVIWNLVDPLAKSPPPDPWLKTTHLGLRNMGWLRLVVSSKS